MGPYGNADVVQIVRVAVSAAACRYVVDVNGGIFGAACGWNGRMLV